MWLDRFSNQSTSNGSLPPPQTRSLSPAPRRQSHLAPVPPPRPGYNPRSSSLSLNSKTNSSSTSLTATSRVPNGSALKRELTPPPDVGDPLDILQSIIGSTTRQHETPFSSDDEPLGGKPQALTAYVDFGGLSLQDFAGNKKQLREPNLTLRYQESKQSVEEYEKDTERFEELHRSITACDNVLKSVEVSLASFQKDLGLVSTEIETLQSRSTAMNTRLENRKIVEKLLGPALEEISISPTTVRVVSEGPVDENWIDALFDLEKRLDIINSKIVSPSTIRAITDIKPLLDNLSNTAVERIRDFLVAQIKALRSPTINAQLIQQQTLARYKDLYRFLAKQRPQLGEEIGQAYINTMRWYYLNHFTRYRQALDKISIHQVDRHDSIGGDQFSQRGNKATGSKQAPYNAVNIGRRMDVLKTSNQSAISSYLAEDDKSSHFIETPFRNFSVALIDNVSFEYSFLTEFFSANTFNQMSRRFSEIFEPTFALGQTLTKDLIENTFDCLGILLCVRLNQRSAFELQRRKVPVAENYINATNILLWPRFQVVMDFHCESVRHLAANISGRSAASKLTFTGTASDVSKQSTAPHYLTQRFGQFLHSILAISYEAGDDEPVSSSLGRLRGEYEAFLVKASKGAGSEGAKRERFLANNYALVSTIIADTEGKLAADQKRYFEGLQASQR